jgi:type I restriction enzyme S subunit
MAKKTKQTQATAREKSQGFKDSALGKIPEGWEVVTVEQISTRVGSGVTPTGGQDVYLPEGIKFVRSQNVTFAGLLLDDIAYIDSKTHAKMKRSEIFSNDILLNITGASIGRCCVVPENFGLANVNQHVCAIRLKKLDREMSKYLCYVLSSRIGQRQIEILNAGGNREGLNYQQIRSFFIPYPPYPEQFAIAAVLSTVDDAIEKSDQLIAKCKRIKQGLMQDLFRYGIDENGQIRSEQTHRFKDSPLGRIPEEWEVKILEDIGNWFSGGTPSMSDDRFWSGNIPWVSAKDMKVTRLWDSLLHISEIAVGKGTRLAPRGAILMVVRGMILAHSLPVGFAERPLAFNQDMKALVVRVGIENEFVFQWFQANAIRILSITGEATHGTKRLPSQDLFAVKIAIPPLSEQSRIAAALTASDEAIAKEEAYRQKLLALKRGLMEDLLTGKVRVTELIDSGDAIMKFAGYWEDMPEADLQKIAERRQQAFGKRRKQEELLCPPPEKE